MDEVTLTITHTKGLTHTYIRCAIETSEGEPKLEFETKCLDLILPHTPSLSNFQSDSLPSSLTSQADCVSDLSPLPPHRMEAVKGAQTRQPIIGITCDRRHVSALKGRLRSPHHKVGPHPFYGKLNEYQTREKNLQFTQLSLSPLSRLFSLPLLSTPWKYR